eukprot:scaffold795_cov375-Prasinococcus_capsulatus_cf.AAC.17
MPRPAQVRVVPGVRIAFAALDLHLPVAQPLTAYHPQNKKRQNVVFVKLEEKEEDANHHWYTR